jgi:DNA-binding PadR family transcriptional regulator
LIGPLAVSTLGLLLERPMHPYEMVQLLLARWEDRLVKVRPGSLYHVVDRLHADGLVRPIGSERAGNRPERTTYAITPAGVAAMQEWVGRSIAVPEPEYPRFPLALSAAHHLPQGDVVTLLRRRIAALRGQDAELAAGLDEIAGRGVDERYWVDLPLTRRLLAAEIDHLTTLADRIESGDLPWPDDEPLLSNEGTP